MPMPKLSLRTLLLLFFGFGIVLVFVCQVIFPIREQARRCSCNNNIRQITLSMHNYEASNKHLQLGSKHLQMDRRIAVGGHKYSIF